MVKRMIGAFHPRSQPWMTRQSYVHERMTFATFPVALAMVEGGVMGVLARKAFEAPPFLFAAIMAAPMFANLTSFFWARLARGRRKVKSMAVLLLATAGCIGAVALLPQTPIGAWLLTGLMILARCLNAGSVTLRSTVWRMNYPRRVRGQVTGRLVQMNMVLVALAPLAGYPLLDWEPQLFRVLYPAAMLFGIAGAWAYSGVRLRGERRLLQSEQRLAPQTNAESQGGGVYEYDPSASADASPNESPGVFAILRRDWRFRWYMVCQFAAGLANMTGEVALVYYVARFTDGLEFEYLISIVLTTTLPTALALVTLPFWAKKLDRLHITRFRVRQSVFWIGCQAGHWLGAVLQSLPLLLLPRLLQGIARGGGALAWNLGHNDFAPRRQVATYMGIHVTLTGIRGAIVPFIAMILVNGWSPAPGTPGIPGTPESASNAGAAGGAASSANAAAWLPGFAGIGPHVFAVTTAFAIIAAAGFYALHRAIDRAG